MPNTFIPIQTYTLTGTTASVTFSNIPQNYTDLKVVVSARADAVDGGTASWMSTIIKVNGSSTGSHKFMYATGSAASSSSNGSTMWTYTVGSNATANTFGNFEMYIPNYALTTQNKSYVIDAVTENSAALSGMWHQVGLVSNNAAVTSLGFNPNSGNFVSGSTFTLYGVSNGVKATGGTVIVAGGYAYHTFTSTSSFVPAQQIKNVDVLAIAGGGGGGGDRAGGGGAGGVLYVSGVTLNAGTRYSTIVGAGGAFASGGTGASHPANGGKGTNSHIANLIAYGGGGGGEGGATAWSGGSGGGAGSRSTGDPSSIAGGTGVVGQGYNGGNTTATNGTYYSNGGAGGGGAGGVGSDGAPNYAGWGGNGTSTYSSWGAITGTGVLSGGFYYYAGGGGAGVDTNGNYAGQGGFGGGGNGQAGTGTGATAGTANTGSGGGGGGGRNGSTSGSGTGTGGSGLVIIRYPLG